MNSHFAKGLLLLALAVLASCNTTPRTDTRTVRWPAARLPADATDLRYEVVVWECEDGVPVRKLLTRFVTGCSLTVPPVGEHRKVRWSVRAHWQQAGRARLSRWLAADREPITTARLPAVDFAKL